VIEIFFLSQKQKTLVFVIGDQTLALLSPQSFMLVEKTFMKWRQQKNQSSFHLISGEEEFRAFFSQKTNFLKDVWHCVGKATFVW
jgi:hypothetical protein